MTSSWKKFESMIESINQKEEFDKLTIGADFSAKLIKTRLQRNLTQSELALKSGLKQSAIARIENQGSLPRIDTVYKLAEAMETEFQFSFKEYAEYNSVNMQDSDRISCLEKSIKELRNEVKQLTALVKQQVKQQIKQQVIFMIPKSERKPLTEYSAINEMSVLQQQYQRKPLLEEGEVLGWNRH